MSWGGYRPNSGRKPKDYELKLVEKLTPLDELCFEAIKKGLESMDYRFVKLYMEYLYGKPKEKLEIIEEKDKVQQVFRIGFTDDDGNKSYNDITFD